MTAPGCPAWCQNRHTPDERRPHTRHFSLEPDWWVTAVYSPGIPGLDDDIHVVQVNHVNHMTASLAPHSAIALGLILQSSTTAADMRRFASALHRAGELLLSLAVDDTAP